MTGRAGHSAFEIAAASGDARPIDDVAFAAAMAPFALPADSKLAVAVSGGADSMALLLLLQAWCRRHDATLTALTVDHGLRDHSAAEAGQVAAWCTARAIAHATLTWPEGPSQRSLGRSPQAAARKARYDLLTGWCRANDCGHLCVAHHADDQVETFLLRLARGSGVDGLAAMLPSRRRSGVTVLRPLLAFSKDDLVATCRAAGQEWIEDPSNQNRSSTRVRFRQARALLAAEGLDDARLLATVRHMQRARSALQHAVATLLATACRWDAWGCATVTFSAMATAPEEIALRALAHILKVAAGTTYGPRYENLERLYVALTRGPWRDATLHGCHIIRDGADVMIFREAAAITAAVALEPSQLWDGRFRIDAALEDFTGLKLAPVTPAAWRACGAAMPPIHPLARAALPMIADASGPAAIPAAGFVRADLAQQLKSPILSVFAPEALDVGDMTVMWPK